MNRLVVAGVMAGLVIVGAIVALVFLGSQVGPCACPVPVDPSLRPY